VKRFAANAAAIRRLSPEAETGLIIYDAEGALTKGSLRARCRLSCDGVMTSRHQRAAAGTQHTAEFVRDDITRGFLDCVSSTACSSYTTRNHFNCSDRQLSTVAGGVYGL